MNVLLTNDDGHRSPLLELFIDALERAGCRLTIVVPKVEQSWKGKSLTRYEPVTAEATTLFGRNAIMVSGTPADCINLAVFHLCREKPDLIASGINLGLNTGTAFVFCSGTVGACLEGNILGIPAVAVSQELDEDVHRCWIGGENFPATTLERLRCEQGAVLDGLIDALIKDRRCLDKPITWNVNLPFRLADNYEIKRTRLARIRYGSFFSSRQYWYQCGLQEIKTESDPQTDSGALKLGNVSITPLNLHDFGQSFEDEAIAAAERVIARIRSED